MQRTPLFLMAVVLVFPVYSGCVDVLDRPGGPGDWAREFLSDAQYSKLVIEVDYEEGAKPSAEAMNALRDNANKYLRKPGGITIEQEAFTAKGKGAKYTFDEIRDLEGDVRDRQKSGSTAVFHVMFLDGGSSEDSDQGSVLGAAYTGSSVVMFKDNIRKARSNCPLGIGCPSVDRVEHAVMVHEFGHILGLVNNGIPMVNPHNDPEHPHHSANEDSVMYWKVETGDILDLLRGGGSLPTTFDADDEADMRAAGGK